MALSQNFFLLRLISPKESAQERDLAPFSENLSQSENLSKN